MDDAVVAVDVSIQLHQAVLIFRGDPNQEPFKRVFEAGKQHVRITLASLVCEKDTPQLWKRVGPRSRC